MKTKICKKCNKPFVLLTKVGGKIVRLYHREFCLECSPYGRHNTTNLCGFTPKKEIINDIPHKECRICNTLKPLTDFYSKSEWGRRYAVCSFCSREQSKKRRDKFKRWCVDFMGGKCVVCGYNKCLKSLDFHHLGEEKKDFIISTAWKKSRETVIKELKKCILVCGNCHGEIHDGITKI